MTTPQTFSRIAATLALAAAATIAQAAPVTLEVTASGFDNLGGPGTFNDEVHARFTWEMANPNDLSTPMGALVAVDLTIGSHVYSLGEVGVNAGTPASTLIGGTVRGLGVLVGDGGADDFMFIFDRTRPAASFFGFTIAGQRDTLWAYPTRMTLAYATANGVPEPSPALLALGGLALLGAARLRNRATPATAMPVTA